MSREKKARASASATATTATDVYPCRGCGAPAGYELLPVAEDGLGLPSYWCRACWGRAFRRAENLEGMLRLLRTHGALRELGEPGAFGIPVARDGPHEIDGGGGWRPAAGRGARAVKRPLLPSSRSRWEAQFLGAVALASGGFLLWLALAPAPAGGELSLPAFGALAVWAALFGNLAARRRCVSRRRRRQRRAGEG